MTPLVTLTLVTPLVTLTLVTPLVTLALVARAGIISATEQSEKEEIARLLVYESSSRPAGERISLTEYITHMPDTQQDVYYLAAPSRELALQSPYFEALQVGTLTCCCWYLRLQ